MKTSVLGSLPRNPQVLSQYFKGFDGNYQFHILESGFQLAKHYIEKQHKIGLDIVNDGEVMRSGYFSAFYDGMYGYLPTSLKGPVFLPNGKTFIQNRASVIPMATAARLERNWPWQINYGSIVVDKISFEAGVKETIFALEATMIRSISRGMTKITMPSPYQIMRRSWHPYISSQVYHRDIDYLEDLLSKFKEIVLFCEKIGINVIQFDDDVITLLLQDCYNEFLDFNRELNLYIQSINALAEILTTAGTAVHICREHGVGVPWSHRNFLGSILDKLKVSQINVAFKESEEDLKPLTHLGQDSMLLFGIIYSNDSKLESPATMLRRLKRVGKYLPLEKVMLSSNCGFSPWPNSNSPDLVWNKLQNMVNFAKAVSQFGVEDKVVDCCQMEYDRLNHNQGQLLQSREQPMVTVNYNLP